MTHKVRLTEKHILEGRRKDSNYCPIANMFADYYPDLERSDIFVDINGDADSLLEPDVQIKDENVSFFDPRTIVRFIIDFDMGLEVKPFWVEFKVAPVSVGRTPNHVQM